MNSKDQDFVFEQFSIRKEKEGYLLFHLASGKSFLINEAGKLVLDLLEEGKNLSEIAELLEIMPFDTPSHQKIFDYWQALVKHDIIKYNSGINNSVPYPTIEDLQNVHLKGKQCVTFGMPKRSCKSLPSGIVENFKNRSL
jgi:hypothetical protein